MKNSGVLFLIMLFALSSICEGSEEGNFCIDFTDPIFSKLDEEGRDIIREYAKIYPKIKDFYRNIRMDVLGREFRHTASDLPLTYVPLDGPPTLRREEAIEVRRNTRDGRFSRVDSQIKFHWRDVSNIRGNNAPTYHAKQITLFTPETGYSLSKTNPNSQFYSLNARQREMRFVVHSFETAPFSVGPILMEYFFFRRARFLDENVSYYIVSARYVEDEQKGQMVELVSYTNRLDETPDRRTVYTIRLSRGNWVVRDVLEQGWTRAGTRYWRRYRCEYDGEFEGMPLLSSYYEEVGIYDSDDAQTERLISRTRWEVTNIVPGPVDFSEFDVAQFLPPGARIGEVTPAGGLSAARIAAIVIGVIFVILGIYLRIRKV